MKFIANLDVKISVWQNLSITFEAKNKNAAKALIEKWNGVPQGIDVDYVSTETLFNTEEVLTPKDNDGQPVHELHAIQKCNKHS